MADADLIQSIQSGDEAALEILIHRYYDEIFQYIYRIKGGNEEAKDITQDVFMSMMKALPSYKEQGYFKAWLYKIAHNRCMNSFRNQNREVYITSEEQVEDFTKVYVEQAFIQEILDSLPQMQRSAIILKYYHGFTAKEIARITGVSTPTAKSRLFQGLRKLRKALQKGEFDSEAYKTDK